VLVCLSSWDVDEVYKKRWSWSPVVRCRQQQQRRDERDAVSAC
jgi:hypothetical protein